MPSVRGAPVWSAYRLPNRPGIRTAGGETTTMSSHEKASASHSHSSTAGKELKHVASEEHKAARAAHKVDSAVYEAQVLTSGNEKRIERYLPSLVGIA
jgi:hypothetical protein